ncbi:hypothetical protein Tco_0433080, partial [Tanacetum coccineum]
MLNKDNYVPWSFCLLCYTKIKPNGNLIYNSIIHGPYVRRMIPEPGDPDRDVPIAKTFHEQTDEELTDKEVRQMEADDQAIQTILMGLPEDIYDVVMAAPVIFISSNVLVESVRSSFPRVILIGSISIEVPVTLEVGAAAVTSLAGVLELDTHSSSEADPSESSPPPISVAPMIPTAPILPAPSTTVAPSSEYPLAPVVAPPGIRRRQAILIRHGEDIHIGQLYRTHPGGPLRALTARKSVIPLSSHCLALRYTSHHLDHFTSGSSSHSSSDHSSGHSISGHSLSEHTPPGTTDADLSTLPKFIHPSLARTLRCSEAYLRWRSSPLSAMSPAATVTLSIHANRALVPSRADLLPPRKRFRDSISPEDCVEKDINTDVLEDIEANATAIEVVVDRDFEARVDACIDIEVDVGVDVKDEVESSNRGTMEVGVDVVARIDIPDAMLMLDAVKHLEQVKEGLQDIY